LMSHSKHNNINNDNINDNNTSNNNNKVTNSDSESKHDLKTDINQFIELTRSLVELEKQGEIEEYSKLRFVIFLFKFCKINIFNNQLTLYHFYALYFAFSAQFSERELENEGLCISRLQVQDVSR